jgi:superfamily I DNA and/or RNA helicase
MELTDNEMKRERRAEEIKNDLLIDNEEFVEWLTEECPHTPAFFVCMKRLKEGNTEQAVRTFLAMWETYCESKSYERGGS